MRSILKGLILTLAVFTSACASPYETWNATFVGINRSPEKVAVIIDGIDQGALLPGATANFTVKITSGRSTNYNYAPGPSPARTTTVSVVFRNLATTTLTRPMFCQASESGRTVITYELIGSYDNTSWTFLQ